MSHAFWMIREIKDCINITSYRLLKWFSFNLEKAFIITVTIQSIIMYVATHAKNIWPLMLLHLKFSYYCRILNRLFLKIISYLFFVFWWNDFCHSIFCKLLSNFHFDIIIMNSPLNIRHLSIICSLYYAMTFHKTCASSEN